MGTQSVIIEKMGQLGEGVFEHNGKSVFLPLTLPGERVLAQMAGQRAELTDVLEPSAERAEPFCPYFGTCGGCALQHWQEVPYRAWKRELVITALSFAGLHPPVDALIDAHGAGRRRVKFQIRFVDGKPLAGFMAAKSHQLVNLEHCPILVPELGQATEIARSLAKPLLHLRKPLSVQFTATRTGLDVDITGAGKIDLSTRLQLTELAQAHDLARLSIHGDLVVERRTPMLRFGAVDIGLPAGGFTQATEAGEAALAALVLAQATGAKKIADLFCGMGPFALRLAGEASLYAADSDAAGIAALTRAHQRVQGLKPIEARVRDLFRQPMLSSELKGFDLVIFDPPRAGAQAQAHELAQSSVATLIAISCNAATFARDAAILVAGGYRLETVTPLDQFKWSAHVEILGIFRR